MADVCAALLGDPLDGSFSCCWEMVVDLMSSQPLGSLWFRRDGSLVVRFVGLTAYGSITEDRGLARASVSGVAPLISDAAYALLHSHFTNRGWDTLTLIVTQRSSSVCLAP
jgi:hypothetical protein